MKKRFLVFLIVLIFMMSSLFTTFASNDSTQILAPYVNASILIDGKSIDLTYYVSPIGDRTITMYPLRLVAQNLGAKVTWDNSKKCALIICNKGQIRLTPAANKVSINGVEKKLNYIIVNKNSQLYVPLEFISDILGARVVQDATTKEISITKPSDSLETLNLSTDKQKIQEDLAAYLTSLELNRNFSGQILVEQDGNILIDRSYGYSDYENRINAFNATTFSIGSVTKQFTAAAISQLAEKNKLAFDDKVSKYLTNIPFGDKITIHQLLTHTSGLFNYTNISDLTHLKPSEMTFTQLISTIKDKPLDFEPGTNWNYSNTNYLILGAIVERISGETLPNYLQAHLFEPAGMKNTYISFNLENKLVEANGYTGYMDVVPDPVDQVLLNVAYGAGFLCSTAEDLYKWDLALQGGKIVSASTLTKIFGEHANTQVMGQYGYGWFIHTGTFGKEISHGGNTNGFTSLNALFPEKNTHIIILTNKGYMELNSIKEGIIAVLNGSKVSPLEARGTYTVPEADLSKYTGSFKFKEVEVTVSNDSGVLHLNFQGVNCTLVAESKDKLYSRDLDVDLKYILNAKGETTGIVLQAFGSTINCVKTADKKYLTLTDAQLLKYPGTYEIKSIFNFVISVKDGKLFFQADGQPKFEMMPFSETEFESLMYGVVVKFDSKESPKGLTIYQAGQQFSATKIK